MNKAWKAHLDTDHFRDAMKLSFERRKSELGATLMHTDNAEWDHFPGVRKMVWEVI